LAQRTSTSTYYSTFTTTLPPPPTSSLFPYTTLFRSEPVCLSHPRKERPAQRRAHPHRPIDVCRDPRRRPRPLRVFGFWVLQWRPDRKSTRLNSSHVSISYAVFCLKKKNIHKSRLYRS